MSDSTDQWTVFDFMKKYDLKFSKKDFNALLTKEQRKRFVSDTKAARRDKEEAQQVDEDFLEAMEYGIPPLGGIGIGIDRLTMFFTNTWSIKEVILFPTMRPEK